MVVGRGGVQGAAEEVAVYALGFEGGVEADVGEGDGYPGELVGDCGEVLEPGEDCAGAFACREEG